MTSIPNPSKKIKPQAVFLIIALFVLACSASFFLGRLSMVTVTQKTPIFFEPAACLVPKELQITEKTSKTNTRAGIVQNTVAEGAFVASRNGTKFYPADCSYADRILPENRVWFTTEEEAIARGYKASAQCAVGN